MEKLMRVEGMHCKSCELLLADVLSEVEGVKNAVVDAKKGTVRLSCADEAALEAARDAIEKQGHRVVG